MFESGKNSLDGSLVLVGLVMAVMIGVGVSTWKKKALPQSAGSYTAYTPTPT